MLCWPVQALCVPWALDCSCQTGRWGQGCTASLCMHTDVCGVPRWILFMRHWARLLAACLPQQKHLTPSARGMLGPAGRQAGAGATVTLRCCCGQRASPWWGLATGAVEASPGKGHRPPLVVRPTCMCTACRLGCCGPPSLAERAPGPAQVQARAVRWLPLLQQWPAGASVRPRHAGEGKSTLAESLPMQGMGVGAGGGGGGGLLVKWRAGSSASS